MPQDPNLYGQPPPKKRRNNMALAGSLDFTTQLTSLISNPSAASSSQPISTARPRQSRTKEDLFRPSKFKSRPEGHKHQTTNKLVLKDAPDEEEAAVLSRTRRKMESKARLYAAMKRGDYVPKENEAAPLVDFDRKWAETQVDDNDAATTSGSDNDSAAGEATKSNDDEVVEYTDEYGRTRHATKAQIARIERQQRRGLLGAEELERMSARPAAPSNLIYGDTIQTLAFAPDDPDKMEAIARKRDRSATPPDMKHYDADSEIRTKGAGFYKFSKDETARTAEMQSLEEERKRTEERRRDQENRKAVRRKEIEDRRRDLEARRAKKMADTFLDGLAANMTPPQSDK